MPLLMSLIIIFSQFFTFILFSCHIMTKKIEQDQIHHGNTMQLKVRKMKKCEIKHGITKTANIWKLKSSWPVSSYASNQRKKNIGNNDFMYSKRHYFWAVFIKRRMWLCKVCMFVLLFFSGCIPSHVATSWIPRAESGILLSIEVFITACWEQMLRQKIWQAKFF